MVQCAHGTDRKLGCAKALHPLCAQMNGFVRTKGSVVGAFCGEAHLPAAEFDDDDPQIAAAGRSERHGELMRAVGPLGDDLTSLAFELRDRQKRRLTLQLLPMWMLI